MEAGEDTLSGTSAASGITDAILLNRLLEDVPKFTMKGPPPLIQYFNIQSWSQTEIRALHLQYMWQRLEEWGDETQVEHPSLLALVKTKMFWSDEKEAQRELQMLSAENGTEAAVLLRKRGMDTMKQYLCCAAKRIMLPDEVRVRQMLETLTEAFKNRTVPEAFFTYASNFSAIYNAFVADRDHLVRNSETKNKARAAEVQRRDFVLGGKRRQEFVLSLGRREVIQTFTRGLYPSSMAVTVWDSLRSSADDTDLSLAISVASRKHDDFWSDERTLLKEELVKAAKKAQHSKTPRAHTVNGREEVCWGCGHSHGKGYAPRRTDREGIVTCPYFKLNKWRPTGKDTTALDIPKTWQKIAPEKLKRMAIKLENLKKSDTQSKRESSGGNRGDVSGGGAAKQNSGTAVHTTMMEAMNQAKEEGLSRAEILARCSAALDNLEF